MEDRLSFLSDLSAIEVQDHAEGNLFQYANSKGFASRNITSFAASMRGLLSLRIYLVSMGAR